MAFLNTLCSAAVFLNTRNILTKSFNKTFVACIRTSAVKYDLMEFFDDKRNWGEHEIKVGRGWTLDELRIKSNTDLHKLWYVLLKERNMLFTMEKEAEEQSKYFPNPERIYKVESSMKHLETVVRERNAAYHELETGSNGERQVVPKFGQLGLKYTYRLREYAVPKVHNSENDTRLPFGGYAVSKFLRLYREKLWNEKRRERGRRVREAEMLIRHFPNINLENLKMEYPDVNIDKARKSKRARGNYPPREL